MFPPPEGSDPEREPRPLPRRLYLVLAFAPILLAGGALAGLILFHCARV